MSDADDNARAWRLRLDAEGRSPEVLRAFEAWRAASPDNERAWADNERFWTLLGALGPDRESVEASLHGRPRRGLRYGGGALAASLAALTLWTAAPAPATWFADAATAPGELRSVTLEDGTRVAMNGASALDWRFSPDKRVVHLLGGEAHFSVAHDVSRPFIVEAGRAVIRVTGTAFDVRRQGDDVLLTVTEGRVEASDAGLPPVAIIRGEAIRWDAGRAMQPGRAVGDDALAWQRGRIVFRSRPLAEVAAGLSRYRRGRILVIGEKARALTVTGAFPAAEPEKVIDSIGQTLPVRVTRITPLLTIIR